MKKIVYSIMCAMLATGVAFAQDEEAAADNGGDMATASSSKSGGSRLPEAGDIGLGFDGSPLLRFFSSGNDNYGVPDGGSIYVRYFLDESTAVRANLAITQRNTINSAEVWTGNELNGLETATDTYANSNGSFILGVGFEKRRGSGRVQGYYGADVQFSRSNSRAFYEYGNAMTTAQQNPVTTYWNGNQLPSYDFVTSPDNSQGTAPISNSRWYAPRERGRMIADYDASFVTVGINGIIGAEYFIAPKIAIGGEFKWGYGFSRQGSNGVTQWEYVDSFGNVVEEERKDRTSYRQYGFAPDLSGSVILNMYF